MTKRILIIGGYGNFGSFIARRLARESDLQLIIAGRSLAQAEQLARQLNAANPAQASALDINNNLSAALQALAPDVVIHTSGPFQSQSYDVALACIQQRCHYVDLADGRAFVAGIGALDEQAKRAGVLICSGASSVPTLTSAVIDHYLNEFDRLESAEYAISTAQKTSRGLATMAAVLSYAGKAFKTLIDGKPTDIYGWLDLRTRNFYGLGDRLLGNCDVPDLELFPQRYPQLQNLRFQAGLQLKLVHLTLFALSWLVRLKLLHSLQPLAPAMLKISYYFDAFGGDQSGFYMDLRGVDKQGKKLQVRFDLIAHKGEGMYIPCVPSILMAMKLAREEISNTGTMPCMGLITLDEYLRILEEFSVEWQTIRQQ